MLFDNEFHVRVIADDAPSGTRYIVFVNKSRVENSSLGQAFDDAYKLELGEQLRVAQGKCSLCKTAQAEWRLPDDAEGRCTGCASLLLARREWQPIPPSTAVNPWAGEAPR